PTGPAELRGVRFILFFRCAFILSGPLFRVKPARFNPVDSIWQILMEFRRLRFQSNPSNLPASEQLCEPSSEAVGFKGIIGEHDASHTEVTGVIKVVCAGPRRHRKISSPRGPLRTQRRTSRPYSPDSRRRAEG
ncbi:hypothetical protein, partial [Streptosporangium sp. NPDC049078]|uniref:hypothetical protein n=1 Tax=Streptosporangium sp. NPDC049078 TaxID=3155767 RepID=UPI00342DE474